MGKGVRNWPLHFPFDLVNESIMKRSSLLPSTLSLALVLTLILGPVMGPMALPDLLPDAEASSRDKRTIRKLKRQSRGLRKTVNNLRRDLSETRDDLSVALAGPAFIEMVTVGNPGNGADAGNTSEPNTYGAVAETFQIGKYEVTNAQYAVFLNAVAVTDTYGLFNSNMESDVRGGIRRTGADGSYSYTAKSAMCDKPVNYVSWFDGGSLLQLATQRNAFGGAGCEYYGAGSVYPGWGHQWRKHHAQRGSEVSSAGRGPMV